jgi:hypothetical protein
MDRGEKPYRAVVQDRLVRHRERSEAIHWLAGGSAVRLARLPTPRTTLTALRVAA